MKQEVRIQLDVSISLNAKYSDDEVRDIVLRGADIVWPNNEKYIRALRYAEERHIYGAGEIKWQTIYETAVERPFNNQH